MNNDDLEIEQLHLDTFNLSQSLFNVLLHLGQCLFVLFILYQFFQGCYCLYTRDCCHQHCCSHCCRRHRQCVFNSEAIRHRVGETTVCAIPVFHHFGIMGAIVSNMSAGLRIVVMETWDTLTFLSLAEEYKVRFL